MEYKNKTSKKKSKSVKTEGRMKNQDAWPPLSLTIYLNTIKDRNGKGLTEVGDEKNTQKNYTERTLITQITTMLSSLSQSQTFWSVKSSGPYKASLPTKLGFPGGASGKVSTFQCRRHKRCGFDTWVGKIFWRRVWQPFPEFLPGESHGS